MFNGERFIFPEWQTFPKDDSQVLIGVDFSFRPHGIRQKQVKSWKPMPSWFTWVIAVSG